MFAQEGGRIKTSEEVAARTAYYGAAGHMAYCEDVGCYGAGYYEAAAYMAYYEATGYRRWAATTEQAATLKAAPPKESLVREAGAVGRGAPPRMAAR